MQPEDLEKGKVSWKEFLEYLEGDGKLDRKKQSKLIKLLGHTEGELVEKVSVGLLVCGRYPEMASEVFPIIQSLLIAPFTTPILFGEMITIIACMLVPLLQHNTIPDGFISFRAHLISLIRTSDHAGVLIRGARLLLLFVLMGSTRPVECEEEDEMSLLASFSSTPTSIEDANLCLSELISLVWRDNMSSTVLLAVVNLLGRIARLRPIFLSKVVPAMVALFESLPERLADHQRTHLAHTLEKQLASLVETAAAEKYYSLIVEVLKKGAGGRGGKRRRGAGEEDEDESTLAAVGTKKIKTEISIDIEKVPLQKASDIVITLLRSIQMEQFEQAMARWRPVAHAQVRDPRRHDPRQAPVMETSSVAAMDNKADQMVPFELAPRILDDIEQNQLFIAQYRAVLEGLSDNTIIQDAKERKLKLKSLLRMAALLELSSLGEMLVDYCFGNLDERMATLLYWLRLLWLGPSLEKYEEAYEMILARMQELAAENGPQWEVHLQRMLVDAPQIIADTHLTLLSWLCEESTSRTLALAVMEQIAIKRPTLREGIVDKLLSYCSCKDEALRRSAIVAVCDCLSKIQDALPVIVQFVEDSIETVKKVIKDTRE